mgnify:CR=1 FL=1
MSKKPKNYELVLSIFKPNEDGISEWKTREELDTTLLKLGNNGNTRHGVVFGVSKFLWEIKRQNDKCTGRIEKLRTIGINKDINEGAPIGKHIRNFYAGKSCVVCASKSSMVIDHKNDLYNDPRVLNVKTQIPDDFQPLCNACNLRKREVCKKSKQLGKRFGATNIAQFAKFGIDFIEGDETLNLDDPNAMRGTYWYDPVEFMEYVWNYKQKKVFKFNVKEKDI